MRSRRIACLLLGLWMGAGLWMLWVAANNSASADRLLLAPSAAASAYLKSLGHVPLRPLAQYLAAEQNRSLFEIWGVVQIALAAAFFFFLLFGTRVGKFPLALALLMLIVVVGERVALVPGMEMVGRATEFNLDPSQRARFARDALSYGFSMAEWAKFAMGAVMAVFLLWQQTRRSLDSRHQVDMVDKTDHRHIDR